jgi:hypothetical protein
LLGGSVFTDDALKRQADMSARWDSFTVRLPAPTGLHLAHLAPRDLSKFLHVLARNSYPVEQDGHVTARVRLAEKHERLSAVWSAVEFRPFTTTEEKPRLAVLMITPNWRNEQTEMDARRDRATFAPDFAAVTMPDRLRLILPSDTGRNLAWAAIEFLKMAQGEMEPRNTPAQRRFTVWRGADELGRSEPVRRVAANA